MERFHYRRQLTGIDNDYILFPTSLDDDGLECIIGLIENSGKVRSGFGVGYGFSHEVQILCTSPQSKAELARFLVLLVLGKFALNLGKLAVDFLVREFGRIVSECERQDNPCGAC